MILLWLGREDIKEEQKHEFIGALVNFQDRCGQWNRKDVDKGFYEYKAYFLAAVGITELKDCSQVDEIVNQIVTWRFGYFNNHSRQWQTFNQNIVENARTVLVETNLERASAALENLIANSQDEYTRMQAAYSLGEIAPNNTTAITALVELIWDSQSRTTRWEAASSLVQIAQNNTTAITVLEEFIRNSQSGTTRWEAASSLVQIAPNNTMAITVLL
ncbi:HEAT repeat domain-containing protein [Tolypothrix bouteillei VB521301_2]|uniref:HEAT repeat domain-containing protein n=1 Tax=Tolypothrix bouteillei TaxID=1246981 RepID=UPI0038B64001